MRCTHCKHEFKPKKYSHRIMCGDSASPDHIQKLVQDKVDIIFTDPPYGIDKEIKNDNLKGKAFDEFNASWIKCLPENKNIHFICYHSTRTFSSVLRICQDNGWDFKRLLWFYRPDKFPVHTWNSWVMVSQLIMIFTRGTPEYKKITPADHDTYRVTASALDTHTGHPTAKIVSHLHAVLKHFAGAVVYDPFCGSGATLIAAEKAGLVLYGMEIDPRYVDVIIQRYENYTGKKAIICK